MFFSSSILVTNTRDYNGGGERFVLPRTGGKGSPLLPAELGDDLIYGHARQEDHHRDGRCDECLVEVKARYIVESFAQTHSTNGGRKRCDFFSRCSVPSRAHSRDNLKAFARRPSRPVELNCRSL